MKSIKKRNHGWRVMGVVLTLTVAMTLLPGFFLTAFANELAAAPLAAGSPLTVTNETDLQNAINNAADGTPTSIIFNDFIDLTGSLQIPAGKIISLSGGTVTGTLLGTGSGNFVDIQVDGALTLQNITVTHDTDTTGSGISVSGTGSLDMEGGAVVSGNTVTVAVAATSTAGGVLNNGKFILNGGIISYNSVTDDSAQSSAGGVLNFGTFTMEIGYIIKNSNSSTNTAGAGGGVFNNGTFVLDGGYISGNTTLNNGGGVYDSGASFTMDGGTISENTADLNGGGIYLGVGATAAINGGAITRDTATGGTGGAVYVQSYDQLTTAAGVTFSGNSASNFYAWMLNDPLMADYAAIYKTQIKSTTQTTLAGSDNIYNQYDVNFVPNGTYFPETYTLTVTMGMGGGNYTAGATVTVTATPPLPGGSFDKWTTTSAGVTFANVNSATTTFTMPANAVTVAATYKALVAPTDPVISFVTRFYQLCLSRTPDPSGLNNWVGLLKSKTKTGADIAYGFVFSAEFKNRNVSNADYVTIMYKAFFNRTPDTAGYNGWVNDLNMGLSRYYVLSGFVNSVEFTNLCASYGITPGTLALTNPADKYPNTALFVGRFYQTCLGRTADWAGLNNWVNNLQTKVQTGADVAKGFVFSTEFMNRKVSNADYVTILYKAFFNRAPDTAGYNGWLGKLNGGTSRLTVLAGFVNSAEFRNLCASYGINPGTLAA